MQWSIQKGKTYEIVYSVKWIKDFVRPFILFKETNKDEIY